MVEVHFGNEIASQTAVLFGAQRLPLQAPGDPPDKGDQRNAVDDSARLLELNIHRHRDRTRVPVGTDAAVTELSNA